MTINSRAVRMAAVVSFSLIAATSIPLAEALAAESSATLVPSFAQGRVTFGAVIGVGTGLSMLALWLVTRMAKRKARRTISAYDRQLEAYSRGLRRNAG